MAKVGELYAEVGLKGANDAAKSIENLTKDFGFLGNAASGTLKVLEWGAKTFLKGANMATAYARQIDIATYKSKIDTETFQKIEQAFKQHKGNIQDFLSVYENMQWRMANWKWEGRSGAEGMAYEALGINPDTYDDAMKLMRDVTKALNAMEDAGERSRIAGILGINSELLRIASKDDYKIFENIIQTKEETDALNEQAQAVDALSIAWDGLIQKIGGKARAQYGTPIVKWATKVTQDLLNAADAGDGFFDSAYKAIVAGVNELKTGRRMHETAYEIAKARRNFKSKNTGKRFAYTSDDLFDLSDKQANGNYIMKRLMDAGYSREWAAAMVGGLTYESKGLKLNALGDENIGGSYGLAQWHGNRWKALKGFAQTRGKSESDIDVQIDYLLHELVNDFGMTPSKANKMSFNDAAWWILDTFENPKGRASFEDRKKLGLPYLSDNYNEIGLNPPINESNRNIVNNFYTDMVINADKADEKLLESSTGKFIEQYLNNTSMSILQGDNNGRLGK